jgi:hypothetical protein
MAEVLRKRVKTRFIWFDPEDPDSLMSGQEEEVYEPIVMEVAPEFVGVTQTQSLPHGTVPGGVGWSVYRVYEKVVIWLYHQPKP